MKKIIIAAGIAGILALTACTTLPGVKGTVSEKEEKPRSGNNGICYELEITDAKGKEHEGCVSKGTYDKYNVGDKYP